MFRLNYPLMHAGAHTHIQDFGGGGGEKTFAPASFKIDLHAVPRVEGDVGIYIEVKDGDVMKIRVSPHEPPRLLERVLQGHHYHEAPILASKICGICWSPHFEAGTQAVENALGIFPTYQTWLFREALALATILQSNVQHATLLSLPDLLRLPNAFPLAESHPVVFGIVRKLEKLGNDVVKTVAGRNVGGVALTVGGMLHVPREREVRTLIGRVKDAQKDVAALAEVFGTFLTADRTLPFSREREFISLSPGGGDKTYPHVYGDYCSSDTGAVPVTIENYRTHTNEWFPEESTGKFTKHVRSSVTVGALARYNNNHAYLRPEAKALAESYGLTLPDYRIAMNPVAQVVETLDAILRLEEMLELLLFFGIKQETLPKIVNLGNEVREGVGIVEAPRGLLIHHYTLQGERILRANCIVPTGQNYGSMQDDLRHIIPQYLKEGLSDTEIQFRAEKIIRDHDPCSSCAVHFLRRK